MALSITSVKHPLYSRCFDDWQKWRLAFQAGSVFLNRYLHKYSSQETDTEYHNRKSISYVPAFASAAVHEVINSVYQRLADITRTGGSKSYQDAVEGRANGVDMLGSTMTVFMGTEVLPELASLSKVGIYMDMPAKKGPTLADNIDVHPYLYIYRVEDICSWCEDDSIRPDEFERILIRESIYTIDEATGLPSGETERYRHYWKDENGQVWVQFYINVVTAGTNGQTITETREVDAYGEPSGPIPLSIDQIPFIVVDLGSSLMENIADIQIALMNLASTDMRYATSANFPFYTEQFDPRWESPHTKTPTIDSSGNVVAGEVTQVSGAIIPQEVQVGPNSGRRYPIGANAPAFIYPSPEPMKASMAKQEQLKLDIRLLINLSISNIQPKMASADSKGMDERSLESGLSKIGLLLEDAERRIAQIWAKYESTREVATISYPKKYSLKTEDDVNKEVGQLEEQATVVPSDTHRREIMKRIATITVGNKISAPLLKKIMKEIDDAKVVCVKRELLTKDVEAGLVDAETASLAAGYPEGSAEKAQKEKADRLKMIQESQTPPDGNAPARGIKDAAIDPKQAAVEKKVPDAGGNPLPQRGAGK